MVQLLVEGDGAVVRVREGEQQNGATRCRTIARISSTSRGTHRPTQPTTASHKQHCHRKRRVTMYFSWVRGRNRGGGGLGDRNKLVVSCRA